MTDLPGRLIRRLQSHGLGNSVGYLRHRLSEWYHERRLGIRTSGKVALPDLGIHHPACKPYAPIAYRSFRAAMRHAPAGPEDVFLDYGAGKGRVLILAATYPFRKVLGVEISPELSGRAKENLERARTRLRSREVAVVTADAAGYVLPDEVTVVHFFDPFKDEILAAVVRQIRASLLRRPRVLTILFADPYHFESLLEGETWAVRSATVPYPFADARRRTLHHEYGVYRAKF